MRSAGLKARAVRPTALSHLLTVNNDGLMDIPRINRSSNGSDYRAVPAFGGARFDAMCLKQHCTAF